MKISFERILACSPLFLFYVLLVVFFSFNIDVFKYVISGNLLDQTSYILWPIVCNIYGRQVQCGKLAVNLTNCLSDLGKMP